MNMRFGKKFVLVGALAAALLPAAGHTGDTRALDQCVQAFVNEALPAGQPVQIQYNEIHSAVKVPAGTRSKVAVVARGAETGKEYGRATCVLNRSGSLVAVYSQGSRIWVASNDKSRARTGQG